MVSLPVVGLPMVGMPVVGMVGGGQLARMTAAAGSALGLSLRVLAAAPDDCAAVVAAGTVLGDYRSIEDLRSFAAGCDVVTFDHEHVPADALSVLEAEGVVLRPAPAALLHAQDKQAMRQRLGELGVPVPRWRMVASLADVEKVAEETGWPVVLKVVRGGYDGRGVWQVDDTGAAARVLSDAEATGSRLLVEECVRLRRELAAVVARSPYGQAACWPVVETVQRDGVCREVLAPAPGLDPERAVAAEALALRLAGELDVVGVLAVELFETGDGLLVNELAMRPHNSAHWTMDGARTSQFEQHLRAVLDYPLGATAMTTPVAVMSNVLATGSDDDGLDARLHHVLAADPALKVHLYGKAPRPGRKIGHVTALGADLQAVRLRAVAATDYLSGADG